MLYLKVVFFGEIIHPGLPHLYSVSYLLQWMNLTSPMTAIPDVIHHLPTHFPLSGYMHALVQSKIDGLNTNDVLSVDGKFIYGGRLQLILVVRCTQKFLPRCRNLEVSASLGYPDQSKKMWNL
ncbi:hypothetical protein P879_01642 [Paragonimus westermani]|uniref:Uncharacterized protein n=1 Tax=Paragonimus westermani TaxID=34504 RepID=A0A8T0DWZ0_9TREM|nr:hypothetical protein P879_01642 [Paragonimus westermani]